MNSLFGPSVFIPSIAFNNYKYYLRESKITPGGKNEELIFSIRYGDGSERLEKFKIHNESYILFIDTNCNLYEDHVYKLKIVDKYSYFNKEYDLISSRLQDFLNLKEILYEDFSALENSFNKIEKYLLLT